MSKELDRLLHLEVRCRGVLCGEDNAYAISRLEDLILGVDALDKVRRANILIDLTDETNPFADGLIDVWPRQFTAHGEASGVRVAVDIVVARLHRQLVTAGSDR